MQCTRGFTSVPISANLGLTPNTQICKKRDSDSDPVAQTETETTKESKEVEESVK